jgi:hypothetical protein
MRVLPVIDERPAEGTSLAGQVAHAGNPTSSGARRRGRLQRPLRPSSSPGGLRLPYEGKLFHDPDARRVWVSVAAVIVLTVVALLLLAMLVAGARRSAAARVRAAQGEVHLHRSHAEASRNSPDDTP